MLKALKVLAKRALIPLLYHYPPSALSPERLAVYLNGLLDCSHLDGDVAEVGCNLGGTAVIASSLLRNVGFNGRYVCYDTFGGFVREQFDIDTRLGTKADKADWFSSNSVALVRGILDYHGCREVALVKGDIVAVPEEKLSERYAAVLLDIDLSEPTYAALGRFWPRICPGGVIFLDDCLKTTNWKAGVAYRRFCQEHGLTEEYRYGLGILRR